MTVADGTQVAQVAALPWVAERELYGAEEMMGLERDQPFENYADELAEADRRRCAPGSTRTGRTCSPGTSTSAGRALGGGERALTIGDLFAIARQALPTTAQYIALGTSPAAGCRRARRPPATPGRSCSSTSARPSRKRASRSSTSSRASRRSSRSAS